MAHLQNIGLSERYGTKQFGAQGQKRVQSFKTLLCVQVDFYGCLSRQVCVAEMMQTVMG